MKNELRGIALLLLALTLAVCGIRMDEVLTVISLPVGILGVTVAFWDGICLLWRKVTIEDGKDNS